MGAQDRLRIALIVYPDVDFLDVAGPCEVFGATQRALAALGRPGEAGYTVELLSSSRELAIETESAVSLLAHRSYLGYRGPIDSLLVAGGLDAEQAAKDRALLRWLRRMAPRVRRLGSICTGAFVLAAAGLLDGRRAATHWRWCQRLALAYPQIEVDPDPIFIRDGPVITSAGPPSRAPTSARVIPGRMRRTLSSVKPGVQSRRSVSSRALTTSATPASHKQARFRIALALMPPGPRPRLLRHALLRRGAFKNRAPFEPDWASKKPA
jgi:transcriptional regulator GlxA family with amidase domain